MRNKIQQSLYSIIQPFVSLMISGKISPNTVSLLGFVFNVVMSVVFVIGGHFGDREQFGYIGLGGAMILFAGIFDMIDGQVARQGGKSTKFGALFDSVLDRYSELIMFFGICYFFTAHNYFLSSIFAFLALIGSMMVSYVRSRAEGLGIECKVGLMQRPERIITIGLAGILCWLVSLMKGNIEYTCCGIKVFETISIFAIPIFVVALLSNYTAIHRLYHCYKVLGDEK